MHNYDTCGGPRRCLYCQYIVAQETPEEACARMTAENNERHPKIFGTTACGERDVDQATADFHYAVREAISLATLRVPPQTSAVHLNPPDPYQIALDKRKANK